MRCKYIRKIFQNEENGYTVALFSTLDHEVPLSARDKFWADKKIIAFTAKGYDLPLTDEIEIEMEGEWETNSHGTQYKVETFLEVVPRTREGILGYLSCGSLKGIGPKTAERIVNRFGLDTLEVMEKYPQELLKIQGISQKKLDRIVDSFGKNKVFRELMTFLSPFHVTPKKANMILQKFRDQSVEIIRKQPYILCSVKGFGFLTVDAIARQCCAATNDPMRISGCVSYVLREAMKQNGHLYLEQEILVKDALKVLNKELNLQPVTETEILKVLYRLVMQDSIVVEENRVYITQQHQEEEDTASMIARKLHERIPVLTIEKELEEAQEDLNITLSEQQKEAVRMVFANPISIITGGPGTGKTTVLKIILYIYQKKCGNEVKLMAPTGRAARRMAESTGSGDATTMHMALGLFGDGDYEALIDELSADFINVDEVSMVDMHLAYEFFYKVKAGARVLLVGDVHQLPSVGAGDVFRQLILCGKIPVTVLNLVYRQGKDSNIPINAQLINEGKTNLQWGDDFQMVECSGADAAAQIVKNIYLKEIQMYGMEQVQILSPYKVRSAAGVLELNRSLQDEVNPPVSGKRELHLGGEIFREGDRILQNKNTEFASKMVCLLLPGQRKCWSEAIRDLRQSFEAEQGMIFVEKYRGKLEWLNSISLAELQRKIGEIYFVDHYKMIADQFLYKKDFETSLFLRIAMETGIRSADIPCIEWSCMHGKTIILEETKRGDLYKKVNGTFPKISTQSLRIMKLLHRKQGKIFTKSNEYYVRKISCAWGMPGFRIHSFRDYRRKIEMGITAGVQVPRIIPL